MGEEGVNGDLYFTSLGLVFGMCNLGPGSQFWRKMVTQRILKIPIESPNTKFLLYMKPPIRLYDSEVPEKLMC